LEESEALDFLERVSKIITEDLSSLYNQDNVQELFKQFDEDKNGFLDKGEMAALIKNTFNEPSVTEEHAVNEEHE
jgi:Ca2+-binding EF-hand superfamily protein